MIAGAGSDFNCKGANEFVPTTLSAVALEMDFG